MSYNFSKELKFGLFVIGLEKFRLIYVKQLSFFYIYNFLFNKCNTLI